MLQGSLETTGSFTIKLLMSLHDALHKVFIVAQLKKLFVLEHEA